MKIGIDARSLSVGGGVKVYSENLLNNFKNKNKIILFGPKKYKDYLCNEIKIKNDSPFRIFYENILLPKKIKEKNISLFHGLKGVVPYFGNYKKIVTVHDLNHYTHSENFNYLDIIYWKIFFPIYIKKANKIIAISESTKKDLIKFLNVNPKKIVTIYEGFNKKLFYKKDKESCKKGVNNFLKNRNIQIKGFFNKKIILSVNTIQPNKNISSLIKSFDDLAKKNEDFILLIAGKKGWKYQEIFKTYNKSKYKPRIFFLDFVPDNILSDLYNTAEVFVYPSFYEGFGLPILEAQACGCPVVTSKISSMPEVAGKGVLLVNPYNTEEIGNAIFKIINDKKLRQEIIIKGFENIKRFSWEKCARETLKVYEEVLNENANKK